MQYARSSSTASFMVFGTVVALTVMLAVGLKLQELINVPLEVAFEMTFNLMAAAAVLIFGYYLSPEWFESAIVKLIAAAVVVAVFLQPLTQYLSAEAGGLNLRMWLDVLFG